VITTMPEAGQTLTINNYAVTFDEGRGAGAQLRGATPASTIRKPAPSRHGLRLPSGAPISIGQRADDGSRYRDLRLLAGSYIQLGEAGADGKTVVRLWYKPDVTLIWLGCRGDGRRGLPVAKLPAAAGGARPRPAQVRVAAE